MPILYGICAISATVLYIGLRTKYSVGRNVPEEIAMSDDAHVLFGVDFGESLSNFSLDEIFTTLIAQAEGVPESCVTGDWIVKQREEHIYPYVRFKPPVEKMRSLTHSEFATMRELAELTFASHGLSCHE